MTSLSLLQAIVLGLIQGLTEFLPISSSAHLWLIPWLLDWPYQGVSFDVALHVGTMAAILLIYVDDWLVLLRGWINNPRSDEGKLLVGLVLASVPAVIAGLTLNDFAETAFRSPVVTGVTLVVFGIALYVSDLVSRRQSRGVKRITIARTILIGFAQVMAIVPGVSRSGVTITAGLLSGLRREEAVRVSFLLSVPIVAGAGALEFSKLISSGYSFTPVFGAAIAASAVSGYFAIRFLKAFVSRSGFGLFAIYRILLGAYILLLATGRI